MKLLLALLLLFPATLTLAEETEKPKEKKILHAKDPSHEDFDYPIITDDSYPFLLERDNFTQPNEE